MKLQVYDCNEPPYILHIQQIVPVPHYRTKYFLMRLLIFSVQFKILYFYKHFYLGSFDLTFDLPTMICF